MRDPTLLEHIALNRIHHKGLPAPEREYQFCPGRLYRFDYAWPEQRIALELEGGVYQKGWHQSIERYQTDCEKYSLAAILHWRVIRCTTDQVEDGRMIQWLLWAFSDNYTPPEPRKRTKKTPGVR